MVLLAASGAVSLESTKQLATKDFVVTMCYGFVWHDFFLSHYV